ncbi:ribonuclease H protein [Trifolium medium]|uniref:Ribonuclease H protein n=1 Tax=Trifolium medium TaxID=97028 RepID=A0A392QKF7_9FABA|nr:ribonuclease H protein [Trifolium medium]
MAELCGAMRAIELAHNRNQTNLWLESDSTLVVQAFSNASLVPWELSNKWLNCTIIARNMNFVVSHVYREGNQCANKLANIGLGLDSFTFWNELSLQISSFFVDNRLVQLENVGRLLA